MPAEYDATNSALVSTMSELKSAAAGLHIVHCQQAVLTH